MRPRVVVVEYHRKLPSPCSSSEIVTYRYFETLSCPDQNRWSTFMKALASQLSDNGLGSIPDKATSNDDTKRSDVLIELRNMDYGRPLLEECVRTNQMSIERPIVPRRWIGYRCDEYFADNWWNPEQDNRESDFWEIINYRQMYEDVEHGFLGIGSSGCDGIDFGYRKECEGLWAYYPGENYFKQMAPTVAALHKGWFDGSLSV